MNKEFDDYIAKRCEKILLSDKNYIAKEKEDGFDEDELQEMAEKICYKQGYFDAIKMMMENQN